MSDTRTPVAGRPAAEPNGELLDRVHRLRLDNQLGAAKAGRGGTSWLPWVLCVLLAFAWAGVAIRSYHASRDTSAAPAADPSAAAASADAAKSAGGEPGAGQWVYTGYLIPNRKIAISPIDVGGRLIDYDPKAGKVYNVVEGKFYNQGDILAQIDPASYEAMVSESTATLAAARDRLASSERKLEELTVVREAEVRQIEAQIAETTAQWELADRDVKRLSSLPAPSQQEVDKARSDAKVYAARTDKLRADLAILTSGRPAKIKAAEADVKAAEGDVKAAEARLVQAKWRLDNCTIRAPISGTVLTKTAEKGSLVNPMAFGGTSGSVCDMADLADLEVELEIPEREIGRLKVPQPCRIQAKAFPDKVYDGYLDRIMPTANRGNNVIKVRVKVRLPANEKPGTYLKPEMAADVTFLPMTEQK